MTELTAVIPEGGASWTGRKATRHQPSAARVKMLAPRCDTCADAVGGKNALQNGWWTTCEHDPYVSFRDREVRQPVYEDLDDGTKRLKGTETILVPEAVPNWVQITHSRGTNYGKGVEKALRRGCIYPQQLRSPLWPNGIKRRCQFRDCYAENVKKYNQGWFCSEREAKLVRVHEKAITLEVGGITPDSEEKRAKQLEEVAV